MSFDDTTSVKLLPAAGPNSNMWEPRYFRKRTVSVTLHEVTRKKIAVLFDELLKLANLEDERVNYETAASGIRIDTLKSLGRDVMEELRSIFDDNQDNRITIEELIQGLKRLGINWLGRSSRVQERANDYLIVTMNEVAKSLYGVSMNEEAAKGSVYNMQLFPFSPVSSLDSSEAIHPTTVFTQTHNAYTQSALFRSASCADGDEDILEISQVTRDVMNDLLSQLFPGRSEYIDYSALPWNKRDDYRELFDYFDSDDDGIITKKNIRDCMYNLGANFISHDTVCQSLINQYIQRKLGRAIDVLTNRSTASTHRRLTLPINSSAHYRDYHGNEHLCAIKAYQQGENKYVVHIDVQRPKPMVLLVHASELTLIPAPPTAPSSESTTPRCIEIPVEPVESESERVENETKLLEALARYDPSFPRIEQHQIPDRFNISESERGYYITLGINYDWENFNGADGLTPQEESKVLRHNKGGSYRSRLSFERFDYGVRFTPFLDTGFIFDEDTHLVQRCSSAKETFRCFFIHLGLAVAIHPFMLMLQMRQNCRDIMGTDDEYSNLLKILYGPPLEECIKPSSFIDASVLCAYWPPEMNNFRLLILTFAASNDSLSGFDSISTYTPVNSPLYDPVTKAWSGEDVILKLQDGHFTILKPSLKDGDEEDKPIYMRWNNDMKPIDFITALFKYHNDNSENSINIYEIPVPPTY